MMTNEQPEKEEEVAPKGALEVNDEDLDQAAGGLSLNFTKIELAGPKGVPADPENRLNNKYPENN